MTQNAPNHRHARPHAIEAAFALVLLSMLSVGAPAQARSWDALSLSARNALAAGRPGDAEPMLREALVAAEEFGPDDNRLGATLEMLGIALDGMKRHAEARAAFDRALAIWTRTLGRSHRTTGAALNNIATSFLAEGNHVEAELGFQRALEVLEPVLGPDHREIATLMSNLSAAYVGQKMYAEAELAEVRALEIRTRALGPDHVEVAETLKRLAGICWAAQKFAAAEHHLELAQKSIEKTLGVNDPGLRWVLQNRAILLRHLNRSAEAESLEQRAASIEAHAAVPGS